MLKHPFLVSKTILISLCSVFLFITNSQAQNSEARSRDVTINLEGITSSLFKAPMEFTPSEQTKPLTLSLPLPNGSERLFKVVESPIMVAEFAALFPTFKTYSVVALDNPQVTGRITVTPYGLNAFIFTESGTMGIRPRDLLNPKVHVVYFGTGETQSITEGGGCQFDESLIAAPISAAPLVSITNGATRRTYRMAVVTTGEFTAANGGTSGSATAVVVASVNAIQAIYDRELSVRFSLLTPFIFTDYATDDFTTPSGSRTAQAAQSVVSHFAVGTFDIGHVFHDQDQTPALHSGGGVAGLGVVCSNTTGSVGGTGPNKAAGWSGSYDNVSNGWYGLLAHEIGHMFNMPHTFNGSGASNCTGNISSTTSYEIGSGNSLMSYNGLCDAVQNITDGGTADDYFHANSLDLAIAFMNTISCQTSVSSGNTPPVVSVCAGSYTIPMNTPFTLTGSGTDANGDAIYYSWEQYDEDGAGTPTQGYIGATAGASSIAPLFRSFPPTTSPSRTFPEISAVVTNGYSTSFEPLPTVARTLNFRLTGRDYNSNGGGIHSIDKAITVSGAAFSVSSPNGGESISAGGTTTVTWAVGGTTGYCSTVNIKMSVDGGYTYPYILATGVANSGSQSVSIPSGVTVTSTARMKVECGDNTCVVFFDISNANFSITSSCIAATSYVCPATDASFVVGNAGLALSMAHPLGGTVTTNTFSIASTDASINIGAYNSTSISCEQPGFTNKFKTLAFTVGSTGAYTFSLSGSGSYPGFTIYNAASYNPSSACSGFVGSNYRHNGGGNVTIFSAATVTLNACTSYIMVGTDLNAATPFTTTVNMSGVGTIYLDNPSPGASYAYTYIAVNTTNSQIKAISSTSDFTSLIAGVYNIYGASYKNTATPASWMNQTISAVLSTGDCALFSTNFRKVTVTSVLPVELLNLQATPLPKASGYAISNAVKITWQTANETNNKGFYIERLQTTGDWAVLGFVPAIGKAGNYEFTDNTPLSKNYYRLRQIDDGGKETFSKVVSAAFDKTAKLKAYPNPVSNVLTIETDKLSDFQIINLLGQTLLRGKTAQRIDVSALPQGTYFLKIDLEQVRFVKQ